MNKVKYFQQGGNAPKQDIQAQVTALVQAAMQGDQKATQTVNQILEAAKSGDQQAVQIARDPLSFAALNKTDRRISYSQQVLLW